MNTPSDEMPMSAQPGQKVLLMSDYGAGKTYSIGLAAVQCNMPCMILMTEDGKATLEMEPKFRPLLGKQIFVSYKIPVPSDFDNLEEQYDLLNRMDVDNLPKMPAKKDKQSFISDVAAGLRAFKCDYSGREFINCNRWPNNVIMGFDGISGLNEAAKRLVVGSRLQLGLNHWGIAMRAEETFINMFALGLRCCRIATAHIDREVNEVTGESRIYPAVLGKKLAPQIGRFFDQVIAQQYNANGFSWATRHNQMALKTRGLPRVDNMPIDFTKIFPKLTDEEKERVLDEITKK